MVDSEGEVPGGSQDSPEGRSLAGRDAPSTLGVGNAAGEVPSGGECVFKGQSYAGHVAERRMEGWKT